ncbi:hypothetical protein LEMLEM_LOCUS3921 [Lemmus lemmus]
MPRGRGSCTFLLQQITCPQHHSSFCQTDGSLQMKICAALPRSRCYVLSSSLPIWCPHPQSKVLLDVVGRLPRQRTGEL